MVVTNDGKNRIRDLLSADVNTAKLGTTNTAPTVGDTDLAAVDTNTAATPTQTTGNKIINSKHVLVSTIGNGTTYREFGVFINSGSTMLSRVAIPDFNKTANLELHTTKVYRIL